MVDLTSRPRLPDYFGTGQGQFSGDTPFDWAGHFLQSTMASFGELIGIRPSSTVQAWRSENPVAGFMSGLVGFGVPYLGWFKATKMVTRFDDAINSIGNMQKAPIRTGATQAAARFLPFEAGRVGVSQIVGDTSLGDMVSDAVLNLALEGGVGGLIGGIAAAGRRGQSIERLVPGLDLAAPTQLQTRYIQKLLDDGTLTGDAASRAAHRLRELRGIARSEVLPSGTRYVGDLDSGSGAAISRLFNLDKKGGVQVQLLAQSPTGSRGFRSRAAVEELANKAGLPQNWEDYAQFPRVVSFRGGTSGKAAQTVGTSITKNLTKVGDDWWIGKEKEEGLFVVARRLGQKADEFGFDDQWVLFKTDSPGTFMPAQQNWANAMVAQQAWIPGATIPTDAGPVYGRAAKFAEQFPLVNWLALDRVPGGIAAAINKLTPSGLKGDGLEVVERLKDVVKEYMTPARLQFRGSPRATRAHAIARVAHDNAETLAQRMLYGEVALPVGKSIWVNMLKGAGELLSGNSVKGFLDKLSDADVDGIWRAWRQQLTGQQIDELVTSGQLSTVQRDVINGLREIDDQIIKDIQSTQRATGNRVTRKAFGHMGVSNQREGDYRILLRADDNSVVGYVGGFTRRDAEAQAKKLQEALESEGTNARIAESVNLNDMERLPAEVRPTVLAPGFTAERQGIRGFKWDLEPFTKKELMEALQSGIYTRYRYMANLSVNDLLATELAKLAQESPQHFNMLSQRLNDLSGIQSASSLAQNRFVDKILGPFIGKNSATQIVRVANTAMWIMQLGAMKLSYPAVNALQFLQTVAPEVAFIRSAPEGKLAPTYDAFAMGGKKGEIVAKLNPGKVVLQSFREMRKPDAGLNEAFRRAGQERVIDPRFAEEHVGEQSQLVSDWRAALSGPGGFGRWLMAVSEWMPAQSERFARTQAFVTGHIVGRDYLRLAGDDLYRFAKQFTENTSYLYGTADRPRMFTTPAGSAFGLFKNWMTNFTFALLEYTGEAARGNWGPLLWQTAGTAAAGGLAATPLYLVANGLSNALSGKGIFEQTYEMFGEELASGINFGLPAMLADVSLYSQVATPLANPVRDATMLFSIAHYDRMQYLGKAIGTAFDTASVTGENPLRSQRVVNELTRALAPTTIYRLIGSVQEAGIISLASGLPMHMDMSPVQKFLYTIGFTPIEMEQGFAAAEILFNEREARQRMTANLGQAYADAMSEGNSDAMRRLLRHALISGIDPSSMLRSALARRSQSQQATLERNFKIEDILRFQRLMSL